MGRGDRLEVRLVTHGSSSCPFEVDEAVLEDGGSLVLTDHEELDEPRGCRGDLRENRLTWHAPDGIPIVSPLDVRRVIVVPRDHPAQDVPITGFEIID